MVSTDNQRGTYPAWKQKEEEESRTPIPIASMDIPYNHYDKVKAYMHLNLQTGFAPADVLVMAQYYAESLELDMMPTARLRPETFIDIAMMIHRIAQELRITPEQQKTKSAKQRAQLDEVHARMLSSTVCPYAQDSEQAPHANG